MSSTGEMLTLTYRAAIDHAIAEEMRRDPEVFLMGQMATGGGHFAAERGLSDEFGTQRVRNTTINEAFMAGCAVGAAVAGMKPIVNMGFGDFGLIAGDEIYQKLAKWRYMHGGKFIVSAVVILPCGSLGGAGPEHSSSLEVFGMHSPGLKVVMPSTPADAKGLMKMAIRDPNPVLFHSVNMLSSVLGPVSDDPELLVPFGKAARRRTGNSISVITYGSMVPLCLDAATRLALDGIELEVIDLRTLVPLDWETIFESVSRTHRAMVVHEAVRTAGVGAEIAARIQEEAFFDLACPVARVAGKDTIRPQTARLEAYCIPCVDEIEQAARRLMSIQRERARTALLGDSGGGAHA
ncbi:alpha-ketoacid dehydrogenase subunit beta [Pandoraea sp. NPDC087047]|uniref:alpha-ketoacid dehydrogenase subunit beta n=1 Tax=Pandoraea sp. NPDC087047 TaxID=3364390 RepID=UPI003805DD36